MSESPPNEKQLADLRRDLGTLSDELRRIVLGQDVLVDHLAAAVVVGGHVLLEGLPGVGKTRLAEALADALQLTSQRVQFTPDLMPADLLGTYVVMESAQGRRTFEFQKGPIFSHLVLADQINRGLPKTQSALLEAMEGETISVANETFELPEPFFVIATQNPLEMEGTFPLPEPQLDRFLLKLSVPAPDEDGLDAILALTTDGAPAEARAVLGGSRLLEMRDVADRLPLGAEVRRHAARLVARTQPTHADAPDVVRRFVQYGASPRGAQALVRMAKVRAIAAGQTAVTADHLGDVARAVLRHRLILNHEGQAEGIDPDSLVDAVLSI